MPVKSREMLNKGFAVDSAARKSVTERGVNRLIQRFPSSRQSKLIFSKSLLTY